MILGLRQGATENATVVGELLGELVTRGLDFSKPRLYVLDGGKALHAAVRTHAGRAALIQRCQVHKRRNVLDHLAEEQQAAVSARLNAAYALEGYEQARAALDRLHRELMNCSVFSRMRCSNSGASGWASERDATAAAPGPRRRTPRRLS